MYTFLAYTVWLIFFIYAVAFARQLGLFRFTDDGPTDLAIWLLSALYICFLFFVITVAGGIADEILPGIMYGTISGWMLLNLGIISIALLGWTSLILPTGIRLIRGSSGPRHETVALNLPGNISFNALATVLSIVASLLTIIQVLVQRGGQ